MTRISPSNPNQIQPSGSVLPTDAAQQSGRRQAADPPAHHANSGLPAARAGAGTAKSAVAVNLIRSQTANRGVDPPEQKRQSGVEPRSTGRPLPKLKKSSDTFGQAFQAAPGRHTSHPQFRSHSRDHVVPPFEPDEVPGFFDRAVTEDVTRLRPQSQSKDLPLPKLNSGPDSFGTAVLKAPESHTADASNLGSFSDDTSTASYLSAVSELSSSSASNSDGSFVDLAVIDLNYDKDKPLSSSLRPNGKSASAASNVDPVVQPQSDSTPRYVKPPDGELASDINSFDPVVPNFPAFSRGSALPDGDCLCHSVIHLARPLLAKEAGVPPEKLTPQLLRLHVAANITAEFQTLTFSSEAGQVAGESKSDAARRERYTALSAFEPDEGQAFPSEAQLDNLLGPHLAAQVKTLTPNQQALVAEVASPGRYDSGSGDVFPIVLADAFPGLRLITHQPNSTPQSLDNHGTFFSPRESGQNQPPEQTVRVFLKNDHYEPIIEKPPSSTQASI